MPHFVYLLECSDKSFYCGITHDISQRLEAHNSGRGAKYTRARRPVKLIYLESARTLKAAMHRELALKAMPRSAKAQLASSWK